jgi:hypothetical protein
MWKGLPQAAAIAALMLTGCAKEGERERSQILAPTPGQCQNRKMFAPTIKLLNNPI